MSVVSHVAAKGTDHGVPHALSWRLLGVNKWWFYKWRNRQPSAAERRRAELDLKVRVVLETSGHCVCGADDRWLRVPCRG